MEFIYLHTHKVVLKTDLLTTASQNRRSQHSQECLDPCRQCFCCWLTEKNSTHEKRSVGSSMRCGEVMHGKPVVISMACVARHCSKKTPAKFRYAASSNVTFYLKIGIALFFMPRDLDLSLQYKYVSRTNGGTFLHQVF